MAGLRVAPPWRLAVTGFLKDGENRPIEVLVYNSLANHYQRTIPSGYRGNPLSCGLLGPVQLGSRDWPKNAPPATVNRVGSATDGKVRISVATGRDKFLKLAEVLRQLRMHWHRPSRPFQLW